MKSDYLQRMIIGAPFGNYWGRGGEFTRTVGTYTLNKRDGVFGFWYRIWRVLRTVRPYKAMGAWVNKMGLPNPGIKSIKSLKDLPAKSLLNIHGFNQGDWEELYAHIRVEADKLSPSELPAGLELSMLCPSVVDEPLDYEKFFSDIEPLLHYDWEVVVKLPPIRESYLPIVTAAVNHGFGTFHCCNTFPVKNGGLSGKPLKTMSLAAIRDIRNTFPDDNKFCLIGGGGVTTPEDVHDYIQAGADHVAFASVLLSRPWASRRFRGLTW